MSVEESPEFQKGLKDATEGAYREWLFGGSYKKVSSKDEIADTMEGIQRQRKEIEKKTEEVRRHADELRRDAERMRLLANPHAREITENLHRLHSVESGIVCPKCGETDSHGNKMNSKPFCFKCNLTMVSRKKAKNWVEPVKPKNWMDDFGKIDQCRVRK